MKIVYIAHPISGDVKGNLQKLVKIVRAINLENPGITPLVPYYIDLLALDDSKPMERDRGIANNTNILHSGMINEMWLYGSKISFGMQQEIHHARAMGIKIVPKTFETADQLKDI